MFKGSKLQNSIATFLLEFISIIGTAMIAIAIAFSFFFRTVVVDGSSMNPTLIDRDRVIITAGLAPAEYGDIVVICQPNVMDKVLIKRCIAVGGQTVDFRFDENNHATVYVDGQELEETYIAEDIRRDCFEDTFHFEVPKGCLFCMGDNRNHSTDCRSSLVGFIDEDYIMGKVLVRIAPKFDLSVAKF